MQYGANITAVKVLKDKMKELAIAKAEIDRLKAECTLLKAKVLNYRKVDWLVSN